MLTVTWSHVKRAKPGLCIHSLWFSVFWMLARQSFQSPTGGHYKTPSDTDHTLCLEVQFMILFAAKYWSRGHCIFLFVWTHIVCDSKQSNQLLVLERHDSPVLHLASRINSCSGLIVSWQRGLKATYFVYSVSNMTLSPMDIYCASTNSFYCRLLWERADIVREHK